MALVKYNNNSISAVTAAAAIPSGSLVHIKTLTASSSGTLSFVHGTDGVVLDSTYPIYRFEFINIHPATDNAEFTFNMSIDAGSNYNVTKTTTYFNTYHAEDGSGAGLGYNTNQDLAQSTAFQTLAEDVGADNDQNLGGELTIYNPSSSVFVKHFMSRTSVTHGGNYMQDVYAAGYGNTTSDVDAIQFKFSSGAIGSGKIKLYGIKDS